MTIRQLYKGLLVELNKVGTQTIILEDFNYFYNKTANQYINRRYNIYDINQQTTDDLRVLKSTAKIPVTKDNSNYQGDTYVCNLPLDYMHLLNCICEYQVPTGKTYKCQSEGSSVQYSAKRLTADSWAVVLNDYYSRPLPERPYYYINNVNQSQTIPTNPISRNAVTVQTDGSISNLDNTTVGTDSVSDYSYDINKSDGKPITGTHSNLPRTISLKDIQNKSLVDKEPGVRYGNPTNIRMEIRCGNSKNLELKYVLVDYLKTPQYVELTQSQINTIKDTSQILEFPDYVCQEILNELVLLVMSNIGDPRLQTQALVTQSIAPPVQQQTQSQN